MAANKFATMLHRKSNKLTLVLVYAMLEWILILLLLFNSLFSYFIIKFADYFGLKRPCLWCSRLDHFFEPAKFRNSYRSLVCETHAMEISKLGYCSSHRKLAESHDMCEDCSSSNHTELSTTFAFFPWMKKLGVIQDCCSGDKVSENDEPVFKCSCCGVNLKKELVDNYVIKPLWENPEDTQKGNLIWGEEFDDQIDKEEKKSGFVCDRCGVEQGIEQNREKHDFEQNCVVEDEKTEENFSSFISSFDCKEMTADEGDLSVEKELESVTKEALSVLVDDPSCDQPVMVEDNSNKDISSDKTQTQHLEFYIDQEDCHLIPIEMGSRSMEKQKEEEENCGSEDFVLEFDKHVGAQYDLVIEERTSFDEKMPLLPIQESEEENMVELMEYNENESCIGPQDDFELVKEDLEQPQADFELVQEDLEQVDLAQLTQNPTSNDENVQEGLEIAGEEMESDNNQVSEEVLQMEGDDIEADVSIGTEIPDHEPIEDFETQDGLPSSSCVPENPSTSNADTCACDDHGPKDDEEDVVELRSINVETREPMINTHLSLCLESNDTEEDKIPDTPTSVDSFHHLHKKLLFLERRESGTEESLDESVTSDIETSDGVLTVEKLKSALRDERKALNALYAELEEERSASAVAANQTMAMINRLQEEKAAMQMEALQYQRMMEEQSEYDQEALQLLNELMVKREKEKAELEKELEVYRKKVQDYETKEKLMMLKRRKESSTRSGTPSACCSNAEDSDGFSVDLNHEAKEEDGFDNHQESNEQNTPIDAVLYLEESLTNFEEERISILEQLKVLEEKLFTLGDGEEHFEDIRPIEHLHEENGNGCNENSDHNSEVNGFNENLDLSGEVNGVANGRYKEMNGKHHHERKIIGAKPKQLLPLFDAIDAETDGMLNGHAEGVDSVALLKSINKFNNKLAIEEEVDHVYERLQALEADREFLKHSITSLKRGDKGIELLQEILHHLRNLRSVELRVRNMGDAALH